MFIWGEGQYYEETPRAPPELDYTPREEVLSSIGDLAVRF